MGTLETHSTFINHLAADSKHWNQNEMCLYNIPKTAWEVWKITITIKYRMLAYASTLYRNSISSSWIPETGF
jgi:hypothetical protein